MVEIALEHAAEPLAQLAEQVRGGDVIVLTRNGREVARLSRADEPPPFREISGPEAVARFEALQNRVRTHWVDEPEFDWKEAIQDGRR